MKPKKGVENTDYLYPQETNSPNQGVEQANRGAEGIAPNRELEPEERPVMEEAPITKNGKENGTAKKAKTQAGNPAMNQAMNQDRALLE